MINKKKTVQLNTTNI